MTTTPIDFSLPWPQLWQHCKTKYPGCFSGSPPLRPVDHLRPINSSLLSPLSSPINRPLSPLRFSPLASTNSSRRSSISSSPAPQPPTAADYPPHLRPPHLFPPPPPEALYQAPWPLPSHIDLNSSEAFIMGCQAAKRTADAKTAMAKWEKQITDEIWGVQTSNSLANQDAFKQANQHACRKCTGLFPSRNKLHAHVRAAHVKQSPRPSPSTSLPATPSLASASASTVSIPSAAINPPPPSRPQPLPNRPKVTRHAPAPDHPVALPQRTWMTVEELFLRYRNKPPSTIPSPPPSPAPRRSPRRAIAATTPTAPPAQNHRCSAAVQHPATPADNHALET